MQTLRSIKDDQGPAMDALESRSSLQNKLRVLYSGGHGDDANWREHFERIFLVCSTRIPRQGCDLVIFVLKAGGVLAPRRLQEECDGVFTGVPDGVDWPQSLKLNICMSAELILKCKAGATCVEMKTYAAVDKPDGQRTFPSLVFVPSECSMPRLSVLQEDVLTIAVVSADTCPVSRPLRGIFSIKSSHASLLANSTPSDHVDFAAMLGSAKVEQLQLTHPEIQGYAEVVLHIGGRGDLGWSNLMTNLGLQRLEANQLQVELEGIVVPLEAVFAALLAEA